MNGDYLYIHKDPTLTDVSQLVSPLNIESIVKGWNVRDLLNHEDEGSEKNITSIWNNYPFSEKTAENLDKYNQDLENLKQGSRYKGPFYTTKLFLGTKLRFPIDFWNGEVLISEGNLVNNQDYEVFLTQKLQDLVNDPKFYPTAKTDIGNNAGITKDSFPKITVWMWCRALSKPPRFGVIEAEQDLGGELINITNFVKKVTVSNTSTGSSFSIQMPAVACIWQEGEGWVLRQEPTYFDDKGETSMVTDNDIHLLSSIDKKLKRNQNYFKNIISENDVVFIRFETLNNELPERLKEARRQNLSFLDIPNKIYDLIGLVDITVCNQNFDASLSNDTTIAGRDLTKLLIEDGCYFYPANLIPGGIVGNHTRSEELQRYEGQLFSLTQGAEKSIEFALKFIINALSNTQITPDSLFAMYPEDRRSKRFNLNQFERNKTLVELDDQKAAAIQSIKDSRRNDKITDFDSDDSNGLPEVIYQKIYNFYNQAFSQGKADATMSLNNFEYEGQILNNDLLPRSFTSGREALAWKTDESVIDAQGVFEVNTFAVDALGRIKSNVYTNNRLENYSREEGLAPGIWQIIKLSLDDEVRDRRIIDSSIGNEMGSIMNYIQKVCQEPFVEFMTDTYGDEFHMIARKPPFDQKKISEYLDIVNGLDSFVIKEEDVISESLSFTQSMGYSWYRIIPQGALAGAAGDIIFAFIKAVHFPEYAKIFGERPLEIVSNYVSAFYPSGSKENTFVTNILTQVVKDLKFIIDSNAYLPFTRTGQIVLNGDRRIKRGTWIYYEATNEVYYVDGVVNDWTQGEQNIKRTTTLMVSRGMVRDFVKGVYIPEIDQVVSYFNIINTDYKLEYRDVTREIVTYEEEVEDRSATSTTEEGGEDSFLNHLGSQVKEDVLRDPRTGEMWTSGVENSLSGIDTPAEVYPLSSENEVFMKEIEKRNAQAGLTLREFCYKVKTELGYIVTITDGFRTYQDQAALKKRLGDGAATPGNSAHERARAIDINIYGNGKNYKKKTSKSEWLQTGVVELAKDLGLIWGGDFTDNYDPVHFALSTGGSTDARPVTYTTRTVKYKLKNVKEIRKTVNEKALNIENILANFQVNIPVFNYFLRREQFRRINNL